MKAHLLYKSKDFDWHFIKRAMEAREIAERGWGRNDDPYFDPHQGMPWNEEALVADLSLEPLLKAMAGKDYCIYEVSRRTILQSSHGDKEIIEYRQAVLEDCLKYPAVVQRLYKLSNDALEKKRHHYISDYTRGNPDSMLRESVSLLEDLYESLKELHVIANEHGDSFKSEGWSAFFNMLKKDLDADYLDTVKHHLGQLKSQRETTLLSAQFGEANVGTDYLLHEAPDHVKGFWARSKQVFKAKEPSYSFKLDPRDVSGFESLKQLQNRGIAYVAVSVGQSADNVADFFDMLQVELAFYIGCINLHKKLSAKNEPTCMPHVTNSKEQKFTCHGLYDVSLALSVEKQVVGNEVHADGKDLIVITGTNTGGKSTFLRSTGIAYLMMQAGMFVAAESFNANIANGIFTHFKREEDTSMESGKFDEELHRMSAIVDHIRPGALILFNESFAATNEREGSEIARQIITALRKKNIKILCVTHLYELAHGFYKSSKSHTLFLQAGRKSNGEHTFKMIEGEPSPTSYGEDLYKRIFSKDKP